MEKASKQKTPYPEYSVSSHEFSLSVQNSTGVRNKHNKARKPYICPFFICFLVVAALTTALVYVISNKTDKNSSKEPDKLSRAVCTTKDCVMAAANMIEAMDETVNPCDDFYEFACGGWIRSYVLPEDKSWNSILFEVSDRVEIKVKALLEMPVETGDWDAVVKAKNYYKSCMNLTSIEERNITDVLKLLQQFGNWPVLSSNWSDLSFNLEDLLINIRQYTIKTPIFRIAPAADVKNSAVRILYIDQPDFGMPDRDYYLKDRHDATVLAYENYATQMAILFGANSMAATEDMQDMVDFEIKLANISLPNSERRDQTKMYNLVNIQNLSSSYDVIDWMKYFRQVINMGNPEITVNTREPVINKNPTYLKELGEILSNTSKRTIFNYVIWRFIKDLVVALPERFRDLETEYQTALSGTTKAESRWRTCLRVTNEEDFPLAVGALFIQNHFGSEAKVDVENMINQLKYGMKELINKNNWMDAATKIVAREKADFMVSRIGYTKEVVIESDLNKEYEPIDVNIDDFFSNQISVARSKAVYSIKRLREPIDKSRWNWPPAYVNAGYDPGKNQVVFPAGILQPPLYHKNLPDYLNFGGIGFVIGHEITHGFDDSGSKFDKNGKLQQWWSQTSINNFVSASQCVEYQYGNYSVKEANMKLNGKLTLGENIADNGAIRESFKAYRHLVVDKYKGVEEIALPGLSYSPNQMFFLNMAQVFCDKIRPEEAVRLVLTDYHSNARSRVIGPLQNFDEFSKAYSCPVGSYMNPVKKCVIW